MSITHDLKHSELEPALGQGSWSERDYLGFDANLLVEFTDGMIEVLPVPTLTHQLIVQMLCSLLGAFSESGVVVVAPYKLRIREGAYREPDLIFVLGGHREWLGEPFAESADLVMEVVSPDRPERDLVLKREEYAQAGIPEYWIVDPRLGLVTVLSLESSSYALHGEFAVGQRATSRLLPGFEVEVAKVFAPRGA